MSSLCLWKREGKTICRLLWDAVSNPRPRHFFQARGAGKFFGWWLPLL